MGKNKSLDIYFDETRELLVKIEKKLIELERNPQDDEIINEIFRALHTIKGSGSMFGLVRIAEFTHEIETVFDLIRKKSVNINNNIINITLQAKDHIGYLLDNPDSKVTEEEKKIIDFFKSFNQEKKVDLDEKNKINIIQEETKKAKMFKIYFKPDEDINLRGVNLSLLIKELNELGETIVIAHCGEIPEIDVINPELCFISWSVILSTYKTLNDIKDVFIFVEDYCKLNIEQIYYENIEGEIDYKKIGEMLLDNNELTKTQVDEVLNEGRKFGKIAVEKGFVKEEVIENVLEEQKEIRNFIKKKKDQDESSTIRVKYKKLDDLINCVGELVTLQAQISQNFTVNNDQHLNMLCENLDRLISEMRDHSMELRLIPIDEAFSGIYRIVRDLSKSLGKAVTLVTSGGETELDKSIIDELKDPLIHIVRNSIDHGIELPDIREKLGKDKSGVINISVYSEGSSVIIKISDDGAGLDTDKIKQKAINNNLIDKNKELTRNEIFNLIFLPGFSTADTATEISGRGVGMDIVKKNIEKLKGTIEIESEKNIGTTISLRIPLTLAIIDGLLFNIGEEKYILNLNLISECIDLTQNMIKKSGSKKVINLRGEAVPYIILREMFDITGNPPQIQQIVVVNIENQKIGFVVDNIIGQHKVVLKSIGRVFNKMDDISGATILGDGTIALVLDAVRIYKKGIVKIKDITLE